MTLATASDLTERVPLTHTADGAVLVEGTRIPLELIVSAFHVGQTAEEIALSYPTLKLADVYAVLAYYLRHIDGVDAYIARRKQEAGALRERIESQLPPGGIRARLLARRQPPPS